MLLDISISILCVFKNHNVRCNAILLKAKFSLINSKTINRKILQLLQTATYILKRFFSRSFSYRPIGNAVR